MASFDPTGDACQASRRPTGEPYVFDVNHVTQCVCENGVAKAG